MIRLSRRALLLAGGAGTAGAALPARTAALGYVELDPTLDAVNALVAFVLPGNDAYSRQQGVTSTQPGGLATGAAPEIVRLANRLMSITVPGAQVPVPASPLILGMVNAFALQVAPLAVGPFVTPFARLKHRQKAEVFRRLEEDNLFEVVEVVRYIVRVLPAVTAFACFSEVGSFDRRTRRLTGRPVGWTIADHDGVVAGKAGFRGYYRGRS